MYIKPNKLKIGTTLIVLSVWFSCSQPKMLDDFTYELNGISDDPTYGYTEINPIKVGNRGKKPEFNEFKYINALRGPNGEELFFRDLGSCCQGLSSKKRKRKILGQLIIYEVTYDSLSKPIFLFINNHEYQPLYTPIGFTTENSAGIDNSKQEEELENPTQDLSNKNIEKEDIPR